MLQHRAGSAASVFDAATGAYRASWLGYVTRGTDRCADERSLAMSVFKSCRMRASRPSCASTLCVGFATCRPSRGRRAPLGAACPNIGPPFGRVLCLSIDLRSGVRR